MSFAPNTPTGKEAPCLLITALSAAVLPMAGAAQNATNEAIQLPAVTVTAQKEPQPAMSTAVSVTPITGSIIKDAQLRTISDTSIYAPNVFMNDFTARKLSNPRFRGIGSSPNNPAVTTYIDGVPQLNANSSNVELVDVNQVEFVRGPQAALFGRNTVGGIINVTSRRPSDTFRAEGEASYGNYNFRDVRASVSGPLASDQFGFGLAGGYSAREGYTENRITGNDLDYREAGFGKGQLLFKGSDQFEARLIFSAERDNDGDYAFGDLGALRDRPHRVTRDFEGSTRRDIYSPTLIANYSGNAVDVTSITGGGWWRTIDETDLDYTPAPLITRENKEDQFQFTQEFRLSNPDDKPIGLADNLDLNWQSGVFLFSQDYNQDAVNNLSPLVTGAPFPVRDESQAELNDWGVGVYGQATLTAWEKLDVIAGLRFDWEDKEAELASFTNPPVAPGTTRDLSDDYSEVSPQVGLAYRFVPEHMVYGTVTRGFKAGGFNPISPAGNEGYDQEHSWNYEVGYKSRWMDSQLETTVALFYMHWDDLQLNVPFAAVPGRFFVDNVGAANSKGVEFEVRYRPVSNWDLFGSVGYVNAEFLSGSISDGMDVSGNRLPYTPEYTGNVGTQYSWEVCPHATIYTRAEVTVYGTLQYDAANGESQDTYSLANFRAGVRGTRWFAEGWVNNAFDTEYFPIAIPYSTGFAPSGYLAESGIPVTFGVRAGFSY